MPRRNTHLLIELTQVPWWVSFAVAGVVYLAVRWLLPALLGSSRILAPLGHAIAGAAGWVALIFLVPIPFALLNAARRQRSDNRQMNVDRIRSLSWQQFEQLVGEAFRGQGYRVLDRGGARPDGGIDLALSTTDKRLVVQCKHWKTRTVGVSPIRELYGAMVGEEAHAAIFVTSGSYTPDAIDFARDKPVKLIDGPELVRMLAASLVTDKQVPERVAHGVPGAVASATQPCPRCGATMVKRIARRGAESGRPFFGCSRYPKCRGTRPL